MKLHLKLTLIVIFPLLLSAQKPMRINPAVSLHHLKKAQFVNQLSSKLWQRMNMPSNERNALDEQLKFSIGFQAHQSKSYASLVTIVESELVTRIGGMRMMTRGVGEQLSDQQKNMLKSMKVGDEFDVRIRFRHNYSPDDNSLVQATTMVSVLPYESADFTGGLEAFNSYLEQNILSVARKDKSYGLIYNAKVSFLVNADGQVSDVKLLSPTTNDKGNELIIKALRKMPNWVPARNARKEKVGQEVKYAFGGC